MIHFYKLGGLWLNSFVCRAEELESALVEMVKEDNRRLLSAQVCNGAYFVHCTFV